jgi:hypothetical protein
MFHTEKLEQHRKQAFTSLCDETGSLLSRLEEGGASCSEARSAMLLGTFRRGLRKAGILEVIIDADLSTTLSCTQMTSVPYDLGVHCGAGRLLRHEGRSIVPRRDMGQTSSEEEVPQHVLSGLGA